MKHQAAIKGFSAIALLVALLTASTARAETPLRRSLALSGGISSFFDDSVAGVAGGVLAVEYAVTPHFAVTARLTAGGARGGIMSGLEGWGLVAQGGGRLYVFDYFITPYVGLDLGVMAMQLHAGEDGGWFSGTAESAARKSGSRFITTGSLGVDLTSRSGVFVAVEAQVGGVFAEEARGLYAGNIRLGYRF